MPFEQGAAGAIFLPRLIFGMRTKVTILGLLLSFIIGLGYPCSNRSQLGRLAETIQPVVKTQDWMPPEHAGAGVTHQHFHLLPPRALITVDWTIGARRFFRSKPAAFQSHPGVIQKLLAFRAKAGRRVVLVPAITTNNRLNRFPFAGEPFVGESSGHDF